MKQTIFAVTALALAVNVQAGGFENARLDTAFMYDEGHSITLATARKDFSVTGDTYATNKSAIGDRNATSISAKYQLNEKLSLGLSAYNSGVIHVSYQGAGSNNASTRNFGGSAPLVDLVGPKVNLSSDSLAILARYSLTDNFSATAGVRYDKFKVSDADIFGVALYTQVGPAASAQRVSPRLSSASDITPIASIAYEDKALALRVELLYQASSDVSMDSNCGMAPAPCSANKSTGGMPDYLTLNFQSGIAEDTLLFGSIHNAKWSNSQLSVRDTEQSSQVGPTSSFKDSTEYSVGLGRKINDSFSVSASYNWEPKGSSTTKSIFTVSNGYRGVSLGARYTLEDLEFSLGYNHTKLGDMLFKGAASDNLMSNNSVNTIGGRIKVKF